MRRKRDVPLREKLPRKCKSAPRCGTGVYQEKERVIACLSCGAMLPERNPKKTVMKSKLIKYLPKEKTVEIPTPEEIDCAICLNSLKYKRMLLLLCNHRFHKKCINQWFEKDTRCPLCRK